MRVLLAALLPALMLFGCATAPKPQSQQVPSAVKKAAAPGEKVPLQLGVERQSRFARVDRWTINGRLGIKKGDEGFSAAIKWKQDKDDFDIRLFDPLGRQVALLLGDLDTVTLKTMDGKEFKAPTAQELLDEQLGWSFPVKSLLFWVKGLFDPSLIVWRQEYDNAGRLVLLDQGDWHVTFPKYQDMESEYIPRIAVLEQKDVRVKFLVKAWE